MLHGAVRAVARTRARACADRRCRGGARIPGVRAVVTAADVPGQRFQGLIYPTGRGFVAVGEETRYMGDVIAAVAAGRARPRARRRRWWRSSTRCSSR